MSRVKVAKNISYDSERHLYYVTFSYGVNQEGKFIKKTKTFSKKADAVYALKEFEKNKQKDNIVFPTNYKLKDYMQYWVNDIKARKCEETTLYGYRNIINKHLTPHLGEYTLTEITPYILNQYFSKALSEDNNLSECSVKKHYTLLKDLFKNAVLEDIVKSNPLDKIEPIKVEEKEQNCYNLEEFNKLMTIVQNTRLEVVVLLAGFLGLRREETCGLRWSEVNLEKNVLRIKTVRTQAGSVIVEKGAKTKRSKRYLVIPDVLRTVLINVQLFQMQNRELLGNEYYNDDYVFCWEDGWINVNKVDRKKLNIHK